MTDAAKATQWQAVWSPWGAPYSITGAASLDARFPGQWYQLEAGLHYNWHRHYDASLGRYTQPDPLGFINGPSVYAYVKGRPVELTDPEGLGSTMCPPGQRPVHDERFPYSPVIKCVPNPSDPTPGCPTGDCVTVPPETNCACTERCIKTWKKTAQVCRALSRVGIKGTKTLCDVVVQEICGHQCAEQCRKCNN